MPASSNGRAVMASSLALGCARRTNTLRQLYTHRHRAELTTLQILSREPGPTPLILDFFKGIFGVHAISIQPSHAPRPACLVARERTKKLAAL